jgi:hypothetical protein
VEIASDIPPTHVLANTPRHVLLPLPHPLSELGKAVQFQLQLGLVGGKTLHQTRTAPGIMWMHCIAESLKLVQAGTGLAQIYWESGTGVLLRQTQLVARHRNGECVCAWTGEKKGICVFSNGGNKVSQPPCLCIPLRRSSNGSTSQFF